MLKVENPRTMQKTMTMKREANNKLVAKLNDNKMD
jgi:hypothetical protein